ncbi:glycosyltransferase [uncultured Parabacteroides sp.]|uniref:glycosyltransferase n=1 Tax=uncultured Parabacteroides sp. TaxID=512312 RepID=UPI0025987DDE|nr:glycosyltransferase [uncultured Parabacteroides sp.]
MNPLVSVVLCTYNGEKYIKEQIDSILNQSYPIYELIVQDDASNDRTVNILAQYRSNPKVKIYINTKALGFNANFLSAILKTTGDYIACSDQDDIWKVNKIEDLINNIGDNMLIFHDSILFTTDITQSLGMRNLPHQNLHETYLLLKPYIPGHQCFFSNRIIPDLRRLFKDEPNLSYDSLICLVSKVLGDIVYRDLGLVYWRRHPNAVSYINHPRRIGKLQGFILACKSLKDIEKRKKTKDYFSLVSTLPLREPSSICITKYMKTGSLQDIFKACYVCIKYQRVFCPQGKRLSSFFKTFLIPLYFIRDSSCFIIRK